MKPPNDIVRGLRVKTQEICDKAVRDYSSSLQFVPDGLSQGRGYICGMTAIMMMMVVIGMMLMKINFLSGMMTIKNGRLKKSQLKKGSYPLLGTHQGGGIGVFLRMRKKKQKRCGHKTWTFFVSGDRYKKFLSLKELKIKISTVLNVSNGSSKPEEFSLKDIEVLVGSEGQNWFKRAHVGKFLGLPQIEKLFVGLDKCEIRVRNDFDPTHTTTAG